MDNPVSGNCCAVLLSNELYRGLVIEYTKTPKDIIKVKIIDYGITEECPAKHVFCLPEHLAQKAPFAHQCLLIGFEDVEVTDNLSTQFDIFCGDGKGDRKVFKMTICEKPVKSNGINAVILEECTSTPVNVNNMLLKNSRPLMETIQLENSKKKQRDSKQSPETTSIGDMQARNNSRKKNSNIAQRENQQKVQLQYVDDKSHRSFFNKTENQEASRSSLTSKATEKITKASATNTGPDKKVGWVSTIISVNKVFVHYEEHISRLEKILDEMFAFYENKSSKLNFSGLMKAPKVSIFFFLIM